MQKIFFKYDNFVQSYHNFEGSQTCNFIVQNLFFFLRAWGDKDLSWFYNYNNLNWEWLCLEKSQDKKTICLWSRLAIKRQAEIESLSKKEQADFDEAYDNYYDKRWDDIPKLYMFIKNYEEIVQRWQDIVLKQRPQFIIISQDDAGYVDLIGKDELSEQDLHDMKIQHEKYLKYKVAYDKYIKSRPDIVDELWHGPESSEYEADWQKYLDEPLG